MISTCLQRDPEHRFPDGGALLEALAASRRGEFPAVRTSGGEALATAMGPGPEPLGVRPGDLVDGYRVEEVLDEGARSSVYRVMDPNLGAPAALRLFRPAAGEQPEIVDRLVHAAFMATNLAHPGLATVHKVGRDGDRDLVYVVTELVEGESLAQRVAREGPLSPDVVRRLLREACEALAVVHRPRIVHGHLPPRTLMLDAEGRVRIVGIGTTPGGAPGDSRFTAPECLEQRRADRRTDVYGLGVTAFHALAGRPPFGGDRGSNVIAAVLSAETPRVRDHAAEVPPDLSDLVRRMMSRDPGDRFPDIRKVLAAIPGE